MKRKEAISFDSDNDAPFLLSSTQTDSADNEDSDDSQYHDFEEKKIRVYRKHALRTIDTGYTSDTSEEETTNTIGNIPVEWYDEFPHIGYSMDGKKVMRPAKGDDLDKFLALMDKDGWKSVQDKLHGTDIVLTKEQLNMLKRIQKHQFPDSAFDPHEVNNLIQPTIEWFTSTVETLPLSGAPEPKRRFVPSKWEASKIMKLARAIKAGLIVAGPKVKAPVASNVYDIWAESAGQLKASHIAAPKMILPGNSTLIKTIWNRTIRLQSTC